MSLDTELNKIKYKFYFCPLSYIKMMIHPPERQVNESGPMPKVCFKFKY